MAAITSSLGLDLTVTQGRNQILSPVGRYSALYQQTLRSADVVKVDLIPGAIYSSNPADTINQLIISTSEAVTLTTTSPNLTVTVNSLFILDSGCAGYTIKNSTSSDVISVQICSLSSLIVALAGAYFGNSIDTGVYTPGFVTGLPNQSSLPKGIFNFVTNTSQEYLWFASPVAATFTTNGFVGGFALLATVTINATPYFLYRSDWPGLGATIVTVS